MRRLFLVLILTTLSLLGASFDCTKAKSDVEKLICMDVALIKADDTLNHLFKTLKTSDRLSADVIQRHKEWINNRNQCKDLNCLYGSYNRQLEYLESKIEYQFATDQKESCNQFVEIFNNHLDVIRYGNFSQSTKEYDGLQWLDAQIDKNSQKAIYGDVDINNDGKKEFVVGDVYPDIGTSRRIIYYASQETYLDKKALANFNSMDLNIFKGTNFSNLLHQKKVFTRFSDENGLSFPHVALFQYKDSIYVFMEMVIGADSDGQFVENIIQYGDLFVVSRFNSNNQQQDMCLIYKLLK